MSLGQKRGTVKLLPYDKDWKHQFEQEKQLLLQTFGNKIVAIEHIGSTSIPGAWAKPIIDINVAIESLGDAPKFVKDLENLGYTNMSNRWFSDRYFFLKEPEKSQTHHLNLVEPSSETAWAAPVLFRDYLIAHPEELQEYNDLKKDLAKRYKSEREKYTEAKSNFVINVLQKARNELE